MDVTIFDIEGDGLYPTKIYCLVANENGKVTAYTDYNQMKEVLRRAKYLVGHNIIRFDIPTLERLLDIKIENKLIDTLGLSWYLYPERIIHGLESWGEDFGVPKPTIDDWLNLPIEEYIHRCTEDVKINTLLFKKMWTYLLNIYGGEKEALHLVDYLSFKLHCARLQEVSGWRIDRGRATIALEKMRADHGDKVKLLEAAMPKVPIKVIRNRPAKPFKKDGTWSVTGARWFKLLHDKNLPDDFKEEIEEVVGFNEPNAQSHDQIKAWLYSLGWEPRTFKYNRDKTTNEFTKIPQVRKEDNGEKVLCDSVLELLDKEPAIEHLNGITVLSHRMAILEGFLSNVDDQGKIIAGIGGLANTLRFKHKVLVNLPGVSKPYGEDIRGCLIAPDGYEICGSDMCSLEDRTKQHYMFAHDPDYVNEMDVPGFDPHLDIAVVAKMMTQAEVEDYKGGNHAKKPIRHKAKTANYACTYGVTPAGLVRNTGMSLEDATVLHKAYWNRNWAIKAVADSLTVKIIHGVKWLYNPVSKLYYNLRHDKDKFSTLNQSTGTYCFDRWVYYILSKRSQLTAQFHDEVVLCIKKGNREKATALLKWAIQKVNEELKLNRDLDVDVSFGDSYAEVH